MSENKYRFFITKLFHSLKHSPNPLKIPITGLKFEDNNRVTRGRTSQTEVNPSLGYPRNSTRARGAKLTAQKQIVGFLRIITSDILNNKKELQLLTRWRRENQAFFPSQFHVTDQRTKKWAKDLLIDKEDRILFFIQTVSPFPTLIGHMGLYRFDFEKKSCQIDNVIRGKKNQAKGMMTFALRTLINWAFDYLKLSKLTLTTLADNKKAIALYRRCGFVKKNKTPLKRIMKNDELSWADALPGEKAQNYNLEMILEKKKYRQNKISKR